MDLRRLCAADVMTGTVHWIAPGETLRAAAARMQELGLRCLLVRGDSPRALPGVITTKDIVNLLGSHDPSALDTVTVGDLMTRPAMCVSAEVNLVDCINLMRMAGVRRMPVLQGAEVIGMISSSDIVACVAAGPQPVA